MRTIGKDSGLNEKSENKEEQNGINRNSDYTKSQMAERLERAVGTAKDQGL